MYIIAKLKQFLTKLQGLSDQKKKIVLWTIIAILGLTMGYFWVREAMNNLQKMSEDVSQIKIPEIQTSNMPDILKTTTPSDANPVAVQNITEQDAVNSVKNLPEVKNWLALFSQSDGSDPKTGGKSFIEIDHKDENTYFVHAYEILPDHTATFNWYDVDIKSGNIKPEF